MTMLVDENENESENVDLSARSEVLFDFIERCARCALMSHDPRAWGNICAMIRKGEQRSVKTSGELGGTVDLWYGTLGCWAASARSGRGILVCLILSMNVLDVP